MKWIWSLLVGIALFLSAQAQPPQNRLQHIESVKVAFITQKLDLNTGEAEKFWPVYHNYQREINGLIKQKRQSRINQDKSADEALDSELEFEGRLLEIRKKYKLEFSKVIPSDKVLMLYQAEREFREHLIKELKDRRKN
jgi:hypothetical protein